jgi:type II secretory pathway pseudopilin PulG
VTGRPADGGESLVEILLSVTIMGIAVSALVFGMASAATTSGYHDDAAEQAELVRNYADAVQAMSYVPCTATYAPTGAPVPTGYSVTATVVGYASGTTDPFPATCPSTGDEGAQQVRVSVAVPDSRVRAEELYIVKRKPCTSLPC